MTRSSWVLVLLGLAGISGAAAACGGPDAPHHAAGGGAPEGGSGGFNAGGTYTDPSGYGGVGASSEGGGGNGATAGVLDGGMDAFEEPHPPLCGDEYKRCDQQFSYPVGLDGGVESSVEIRGDFVAGGWDQGVALQKNGSVWSATIPVPYNFEFQYKFVINQSLWVTDPTNPNTVSDGKGGHNSVFAGQSCSWWSCSNDPAPLACDLSVRTCSHTFLYGVHAETTVSVFGDFNSWALPGVPMVSDGTWWTAKVDLPWGADVLYKYVIDGNTYVSDPNNPNQVADGYGGFNSQIKNEHCGWWSCGEPTGGFDWRDAVMYFVFVDRFLDGDSSNNGAPVTGVELPAAYQGGDWAGVLQKINEGYFSDLGINTLWLTVPMDNPEAAGMGSDGHLYSAYHGYWPSDLDHTEERFGTMTELQNLVGAAHDHSMKVVLDYAMNHVHQDAPIVALHSGWFWPLDFTDGNGSHHCVCGDGSCPWDGQYAKRCWFRDYLPDFNFSSTEARKYSVDNAIGWAQQTGADGLRLDAVKHIEDSWLIDLRSRVKAQLEPISKQHFYMVGETYTSDPSLIRSYVNPQTMLDGQFDFPLRAKLASTLLTRQAPLSDLAAFMDVNDAFYGKGVMSTFIGNHDMPRAIHFAQDNALWNDVWSDGKDRAWSGQPTLPTAASAFERLANAFTVLFTSNGIPLVYYGDEVGMPGAGDPDNRRMMQWSGYSAGQQQLLGHLKKLGAIRAGHPALRRGSRTTVAASAETYAYKMSDGQQVVYVVVNRGDLPQDVAGMPSGQLQELLSGVQQTGPTLNVAARSSMILIAK
jgi:glycosidase